MPIIVMLGLGLAVVVFFIMGISLIYKSQDELINQEVLPVRKKYDEVAKTLDATRTEEQDLKQKLDSLAVKLHETQGLLTHAKEAEKELVELKVLEQEDQEKIKRLSTQLEQLKQKADIQDQGTQEMTRALDTQKKDLHDTLMALRHKADEQAKGSLSVIERLIQQTRNFQEQVAHLSQRPDNDEFNALRTKNQSLQEEVEKLLTQIQAIDRKLRTDKETSGQDLAAAREKIAQLSGEGDQLKIMLRQITAKIDETKNQFLTVKETYENQLAESQSRLERAQEEKLSLERQSVSADQFNDLAAELYKVREEKAQLAASVDGQSAHFDEERAALLREISAHQEKIAELEKTISHRLSELPERGAVSWSERERQDVAAESRDPLHVASLLHDKRVLEQTLTELERTNQALVEREKMLFGELMKLKVKSLGLEKICAGMKGQLDQA